MQILLDFIFGIIHPSRTQHVDWEMLRPITKSPLELLPHHLPHSAGLHYMDLRRVPGCFGIACFSRQRVMLDFYLFSLFFSSQKQYITAALGPQRFWWTPRAASLRTTPLLSAFAASNSGSRLLLATAQDADVMIDERYYAECDGLETG